MSVQTAHTIFAGTQLTGKGDVALTYSWSDEQEP